MQYTISFSSIFETLNVFCIPLGKWVCRTFSVSLQQKLECISPASSLLVVTGTFVSLLQEHLKRCLCNFNVSQSPKSYHFLQLLLECWGCSESSGSTSEQMTAQRSSQLTFLISCIRSAVCLVQISPVWLVGLLVRQNHTPHMDFLFEALVHQL